MELRRELNDLWMYLIVIRNEKLRNALNLQALFNEYAWYKPDEEYSDAKLSDIDKANIKLIQEFE